MTTTWSGMKKFEISTRDASSLSQINYLDSHHTRGGYEISHTNFTYTFISIILTTSHICFICSVVCQLCPIYKDKILEKQVRLRRTINCDVIIIIKATWCQLIKKNLETGLNQSYFPIPKQLDKRYCVIGRQIKQNKN